MTVVLLIIIFLALIVFPLIVSRAAEKKDKNNLQSWSKQRTWAGCPTNIKNREENTKGKTAWMRKSINKAMFVQSRLFHTTLVCRQARQWLVWWVIDPTEWNWAQTKRYKKKQ